MIYRAIKKLEHAISSLTAIPGLRDQGWTYDHDPEFPDCLPDTVNGFRYLHQIYTTSDPTYTGKVTVPTLWDKKTGKIVNNEFLRDHPHAQQRVPRHRRRRPDYYPEPLRAEIDRINDFDLREYQQRRLSLRLCQIAGSLR